MAPQHGVSRLVICLLVVVIIWILASSSTLMLAGPNGSSFDALRATGVSDRRTRKSFMQPKKADEPVDILDDGEIVSFPEPVGVEIACPEDRRIRGIVNDNFCDCPSGADEPLTSACSPIDNGKKFECLRHFAKHSRNGIYRQRHATGKHLIYISRVDDGVCDCCDGSDEENGSRCENMCEKLSPEAEKRITLASSMRALPRTDLSCTKCPDGDGGPDGIMSYLTLKCLRTVDDKYEYCPFRRGETATLLGKGVQNATILGRGPGTWEEKYSKVLLFPGDPCPSGKKRRTHVEFLCSPETALVSVIEDVTCATQLIVTTPAVCSIADT